MLHYLSMPLWAVVPLFIVGIVADLVKWSGNYNADKEFRRQVKVLLEEIVHEVGGKVDLKSPKKG
jgi:hypothetical protein